MDIISACREAGTFRGAAVISGTTPKTVKRVIARHEAGGGAPVRSPRGHNDDVVAVLVAERVTRTSGRISAKRLLPAARAAGYSGSPRNFRRLVTAARQAWRRDHHRGRRPAVWSPGEYLVIDWGAGGGLHVFCAVLAWSRFRFVRFAADERSETTLAMLAECLEVLGGVPGKVLADRMGCLKGGVAANVVVPAPEYLRFAAHYGFKPDFCEANDPESKGIAENLAGYAKSGLMVPQAPFGGFTAANEAAAAWCAEVSSAVRSEICAVPAERLVIERELLAPLPSLRAGIGRLVMRKAGRLACVRFAPARYPVPVRLTGTQAGVRADDGRLLAVVTAAGEVVAGHILVAPGEAPVLDEHYGGPRPAPRRAVRPKTAAEKAFCALGPVAEAFITGAAAAGHTRLGPELAELNMLRAARGEPGFLAALSRAVAFGRWRAADVRSILAAGPGTAGPPTAGGTRWCSSCPSSRSARCRITPSAGCRDRGHAAAGPRPRRGPAAAQAGGDAPARPGAAPDRQDPAAGPRRAAAHPGRSRDQRPRRLQRPHPHQSRRIPGDQDPGGVRPGRLPGPAGHLRLPGLAGMDPRPGEPVPGRAGTGKSHLLVALGAAAAAAGHKVRYCTAAELTETLYRGLAGNSAGRVIGTMLRNDLILIDEAGFAPLDDTGAQLLFRVVAAACERRALGIASHWPFESRGRFLPEHTTAVSLPDRLLHHANVVVTDGDSYRMREARTRKGTTLNKS